MKNFIEEVAISGVDGQPLTLTPEKGQQIAKAFLYWLTRQSGKTPSELNVAVGQDPRLSGRLLKIACFDALVPYGVTCYDCSLSAVPAMQSLTAGLLSFDAKPLQCDAAILITSPSGPSHWNGIKFFIREGNLKEEDYAEIMRLSESDVVMKELGEPTYTGNHTRIFGKKVYQTTELPALDLYSELLRNRIVSQFDSPIESTLPLKGLRVALDAGNGTGGFIARTVLAPLGADISCSQFLDPDGNFFNHLPDVQEESALRSIAMKTLSGGCDLGILVNGDVSSFVVLDNLGFPFHYSNEEEDLGNWLIENLPDIMKKKLI